MGVSASQALVPAECDLRALGLEPGQVTSVEMICRRWVNTIYRICCSGEWYVLKWVQRPEMSGEVRAYEVLSRCGVLVLPYRASGRALLLEDLMHSDQWRLADEQDMEREETGAAVAGWYRQFHQAGRELVQGGERTLDAMKCEAEKVTAEGVHSLAGRLGLPQAMMERAAAQVGPIVQAILRQARTLNYNDFHWSNLAMERAGCPRAIVFDYHLLGAGMAYSDCRNAMQCLRGRAVDAFREAYGPMSEVERVLDRPIATLHGLLQAAESPRMPTWAKALMEEVESGRLERELCEALALAEDGR